MENIRKKNIDRLLEAVITLLEYEPLDFDNEEEQAVYTIANDLKDVIGDFLTT